MKLTRSKENEIWQVYSTWLTAYMNADFQTYAYLLDDDYHFIGSTINEEFLNRHDAITFFEETGEQFAGVMDLRNENKILEVFERSIFITHFCDVWFLNEMEHTYYGRFRLSSVMLKRSEGWRFIYQHFSMPDSKSDEGDSIGFDKVSAENTELREAIKRRTIELENKNRELEVEAALERIRSRSSAMQHSDELGEVIALIFEILDEFNISVKDGVALITFNKDNKDLNEWMANPGFSEAMNFHLPYFEHPVLSNLWDAKNRGEDILIEKYSAEESRSFLNHIFEHSDFRHTPDSVKEYCLAADTYATFIALQKHTGIFINDYSGISLTSSEIDLLKKFSAVFEQTYTRFLDIQKAEAQARESQIEAALERVRSRTMGMQKSSELADVAAELFAQMNQLVNNLWTCGFVLCEKDRNEDEWWLSMDGDFTRGFFLPNVDDYAHASLYEGWMQGEDFRAVQLDGEALQQHYDWLMNIPVSRAIFEEMDAAGIARPDWQKLHAAYFSKGYLVLITREPCDKEEIFKRFASVFDLTYTRFLDLQKAEEQAREAQIEAALERVRSRSMGMQKSSDIRSVVDTMYGELKGLGLIFHAVVIQLLLDDTKDMHMWINIGDGSPYDDIIHWPYVDIPMFNAFYEARTGNKTFAYRTSGEVETREFFEEYVKLEAVPEERKEALKNVRLIDNIGTYQKHTGVFLMRYVEGEFSGKDQEIVRRFSKVFEQTYTRFLDLQKAEEQAAEAIKQASLDRVRGEISSMRSADDLQNITPLIWNELKMLDVSFIRCGVFIFHEDEKEVEVYLSKPDGTSLAVMHLPFDSNKLVADAVEAWQNNEVFTQRWSQQEFLDFGKGLMEQDQIADLESYQGAEKAPESLHLHFIPFNQGMLYVGSTGPLEDEEISLSESLAKTFSIAYARYEDFVKLEKAKAGIEEALSELKATQSQLVQQEKLASLGQLTAGIAHEIKNPLNFVNNFSELSVELIEEVRDEIKSVGAIHELPLQIVNDILNDIEANLRKIHEHGTRADGIVKSMLQHSRGGSGKMEPEDLNALIKEYANLAFHGMRAGKQPINVDIELELDEEIGEVKLIAEDFSRVIVNLCNNAFDAMREQMSAKDLQGLDEYQPKLTIRTFLQSGTVNIEIEDNGPGIPDEIKDKILQPFFTTKKGTAGTGLGLSITSDIIKAHGGVMSLSSQSAQPGTTFIIELPK